MAETEPFELITDFLKQLSERREYRLLVSKAKNQWQVARRDPFRLVTLNLQESVLAADCDGKRSKVCAIADPDCFPKLEGFLKRRFA